jgi:hypothetical protein
MRKFGVYPIAVNYNLHTRLRYQHKEDDFHRAGRYEEERQLDIKVNTSSDSTIENNLYKQELNAYEQTVCNCLRKIEGNPVGRMVLGLINKKTTVWIVPKSDEELKQCTCALTGPLKYEIQTDGSYARGVGFGDTVIFFHPKLGDDTLFHELVHAYRYSYKKFHPMCIILPDRSPQGSHCGSTEEVLAHQMENIYMSRANRPLTLDYYAPAVVPKDEIYDFLAGDAERLMTLKHFLRHEYLAMLAAHSFATDYNPFRDYGVLEAKHLKGTSLPALPEMGTVLQVGKDQQ